MADDEKIFHCPMCSKRFAKKKGLSTHMQVHNRVQCEVCRELVPVKRVEPHMLKFHPDVVARERQEEDDRLRRLFAQRSFEREEEVYRPGQIDRMKSVINRVTRRHEAAHAMADMADLDEDELEYEAKYGGLHLEALLPSRDFGPSVDDDDDHLYDEDDY